LRDKGLVVYLGLEAAPGAAGEKVMGRKATVLTAAWLLAVFVCIGCSEADKAEPPGQTEKSATPEEEKSAGRPEVEGERADEKPLDGEEILKARCTRCHTLDKVKNHAKVDREHWARTVDRMVQKGAKLTEEERSALLDHLANQ
jgi:hypothetical protein